MQRSRDRLRPKYNRLTGKYARHSGRFPPGTGRFPPSFANFLLLADLAVFRHLRYLYNGAEKNEPSLSPGPAGRATITMPPLLSSTQIYGFRGRRIKIRLINLAAQADRESAFGSEVASHCWDASACPNPPPPRNRPRIERSLPGKALDSADFPTFSGLPWATLSRFVAFISAVTARPGIVVTCCFACTCPPFSGLPDPVLDPAVPRSYANLGV